MEDFMEGNEQMTFRTVSQVVSPCLRVQPRHSEVRCSSYFYK